MMKGLMILAVLWCGAGLMTAAENNAAPALPLKTCVLDFTTADIQGQQRFLKPANQTVRIPEQCTLNQEDRKSVNSIMQGFVRMIDAWDNMKTGQANRTVKMDQNVFARTKALELYRTVVKGPARPVVIGADYLAAYLSRHPEVFACTAASAMEQAMLQLQSAPDFPQEFMPRLAAMTRTTHLIHGTVSDVRKKVTVFKGYGIETQTTVYELDVILRVTDLTTGKTVYSNVYTGIRQEQIRPASAEIQPQFFDSLLKSALERAAEDLYSHFKNGGR